MFKIGMALIFAVIAALVVIIAGVLGSPRLVTVFLRSFLAFVVTWAVVWFVLFLLEAKGVIGFDKNLELIEPEDGEPTDEELAAHAAEAEGGEQTPEDTAEAAEDMEAEGDAGFQPLSTDNLKHMDTSGTA
ncbi:hypothetical protein [Selenomonas sp.]|uniref:hypothetical protein n=1 Tax=Selenomonas sp. TaxID=2053611 RepID=UPI0025CBFEFA|nr:hypothetical protein [Selenomonas sp.]MCI6084789.1 hypothetical protein [Selenomonas sp.]MDY3298032.1 hypothetical protein [Selenomonas sp.]MDY4416714.1 hypothetical protein [Selenomonas sp.]